MKKNIRLITTIVAVFLAVVFFTACNKTPEVPQLANENIKSPADLKAHNEEFKRQVIEVTEGVHVAIGYGLANSIMIEGDDGVIIVDCMESNESAALVKAEFAKITDKPVKALIYTHNHADHIFGAGVMAGADKPEIYAHELTNYYIDRLLNVIRPIVTVRSYRMFGNHLEGDSHVNCGIGPALENNAETTRSILRPTVTFKDELEIEIAGVKLKLVHAPGETEDQLFVHLTDKNIILCGDNFYKAFPNLYTIRGTSYRDVKKWAASLDKIRYLRPDYLIPSHTKPLVGADLIFSSLTDYRDAIQFVHDQTIRQMNKGKTRDEIAELVVLPPHLKSSPYLQEFYGRVDWSAKSVFTGYLGFFDGNASTLLPLPEKEKAENMAALAGGEAQLLENVKTALAAKKYQWALELTDYLLVLSPENEAYQSARYEALMGLGIAQSNPNARHYYLTNALETKGLEIKQPAPSKAVAEQLRLESIFEAMATKLDPEKSANLVTSAVFNFPDVKKSYSVQVRKGIAEVQFGTIENPDLTVTVNSEVYKELATKLKTGKAAYLSGELKVSPNIKAFSKFMKLFE